MSFKQQQTKFIFCWWDYWQCTFKKSQTDLLSDYVNPKEEDHMNLTRVKKTADDNNWGTTSPNDFVVFSVRDKCLIDTESTYSFLNECFDIILCDG